MNEPAPVKLYVGAHYREPSLYTYTELLFPFWGVAAKESMPYMRAAALRSQYRKEDFTLVDSIAECDYVLMPYSYDRLMMANPSKISMIAEEAQAAGKPLLIDGAGDIERPIAIPNSVILRVSQYRYAVQQNEITIPFAAEDLLASYYEGVFTPRKKQDMPSVGFTGWSALSFMARMKLLVKELPITLAARIDPKRGAEHKGLLFRARALHALSNTKGVVANFIARATYSGHIKTIEGNVDETRRAFVENLAGSDYALIVRGDANSSIRFYEALSMGRIPLFLDTACVLPLEDRINYKDFCVFVDWRDTNRIGEKLLEFHRALSPERFTDMQRKAREAFAEYLRQDSFSRHLADILRRRHAA